MPLRKKDGSEIVIPVPGGAYEKRLLESGDYEEITDKQAETAAKKAASEGESATASETKSA